MDMKKWLLTGTLISTLGAFSACSEDPSSDPVGPVDSSGSLVPDSSGDVPGSSDGQPTAKIRPRRRRAAGPDSHLRFESDRYKE